jgi:hypothetical protein
MKIKNAKDRQVLNDYHDLKKDKLKPSVFIRKGKKGNLKLQVTVKDIENISSDYLESDTELDLNDLYNKF